MSSDDARRARAAARAALPIRQVALRDEEAPDLSHLDPSGRVALVWALTLDAWASSGRTFPDYTRAETPGQMIRGMRNSDAS